MSTNVKITFKGKFTKLEERVLNTPETAERIMGRWIELYQRYTPDRFDELSRGGSAADPEDGVDEGPWAPLAESTLGGHARKNLLTLVRTGLLREAVRSANVQGAVVMDSPGRFYVTANYSNPLKYPDSELSTDDVLGFHQNPRGGRPPQRKVLGQPDAELRLAMAEAGKEEIVAALED